MALSFLGLAFSLSHIKSPAQGGAKYLKMLALPRGDRANQLSSLISLTISILTCSTNVAE